MELSNYPKPTVKKSGAREAKEALMEQIMEATGEPDNKDLARNLSITANTLCWPEQLHTLYQRRIDPKIKNYAALVTWYAKVTNKAQPK